MPFSADFSISHLPATSTGAPPVFAPGATLLLQRLEVLLYSFTSAKKVSEAPSPHPSACSTHQGSALLACLLRQPLPLFSCSVHYWRLNLGMLAHHFSGRILATASALGPACLFESQHLLWTKCMTATRLPSFYVPNVQHRAWFRGDVQ